MHIGVFGVLQEGPPVVGLEAGEAVAWTSFFVRSRDLKKKSHTSSS